MMPNLKSSFVGMADAMPEQSVNPGAAARDALRNSLRVRRFCIVSARRSVAIAKISCVGSSGGLSCHWHPSLRVMAA